MDGEDQATQGARVQKLWKVLDTRNEGQLNLNGLKKGLSKMDHRSYILFTIYYQNLLTHDTALKSADSLLEDVMKAVDTNGDGHIEYTGAFRANRHTANIAERLI